MRYLSVCSGIEAATVAWHPLGWEAAAFSEIEAFPRAVLQHHYPDTPLHGDFTTIGADDYGPIDLLVGGTPCQSFSVAGKRLGLDDPRGNLTLEFLALARRVRPRWIVWENVPGVLSHDEGRTMGTFLRIVGECGFRWAYRVLDAQYVRVGRFGRAVPQRRRRVFLVGYSGAAGIDPRAVLFDRESLRGNPAPRRQAGERTAPTLATRTRGGGGLGTDFDCDGGLIPQAYGGGNTSGPVPVAAALAAHGRRQDFEVETFVAHALRAEGFDASEDGTGCGTPLVSVGIDYTNGIFSGDIAGTIEAAQSKGNRGPGVLCFSAKDHGADAMADCSPTPRAGGVSAQLTTGGGKPGQGQPCVVEPFTIMERGRSGEQSLEHRQDGTSNAILTPNGGRGGMGVGAIAAQRGVRRLTPRECERLQAFPDDFTKITWRGKSADKCPDGPRYKALGNSMAVNCMAWIGERIAAVEAVTTPTTLEAMGEVA